MYLHHRYVRPLAYDLQAFDAILSRLRYTQPPHKASQKDDAVYVFIVSCYMCARRLTLDELEHLSGTTGPSLFAAVYAVLRRLSPRPLVVPSTFLRHGRCLHHTDDTTCVVVTDIEDGSKMVCKQIDHETDGLPAYQAVVEIVVHYLLDGTGATHVAPLRSAEVSRAASRLYYDYVPHPLRLYFGHASRTVVRGLLRGVQQMHAQGICHRDLKGPNIHVHDDEWCMLLDVGSAGAGRTRRTVPITTISHRAPEILRAEMDGADRAYDGFKLDIWSVGVLLAELCLGPNPFGHIPGWATASDMFVQIEQMLPDVLTRLRVHWTTAEWTHIHRCFDPCPERRPTIHQLVQAL